MKQSKITFDYKKYPDEILEDFQFCVEEAFYILREEIQARKSRKENKK